MSPTKERKIYVRAERTKRVEKERCSLGTPSPDPWDLRVDANPGALSSPLGFGSTPDPSLVLAPESALSLLPSRGLSSAPVACSVSAVAALRQQENEKRP